MDKQNENSLPNKVLKTPSSLSASSKNKAKYSLASSFIQMTNDKLPSSLSDFTFNPNFFRLNNLPDVVIIELLEYIPNVRKKNRLKKGNYD